MNRIRAEMTNRNPGLTAAGLAAFGRGLKRQS